MFQDVKNVDGHFVLARGNEGVDSDSVILLEVFCSDFVLFALLCISVTVLLTFLFVPELQRCF